LVFLEIIEEIDEGDQIATNSNKEIKR